MTAPIIDTRTQSHTFPLEVDNPISREQYLDMFENLLRNNNMIFVYGDGDGCGVTTTLAMFVKRHCSECFSFFNNGMDLFSQESDVIEDSLAHQMFLYNNNGTAFQGDYLDMEGQIPALKRTGRSFYFVFDGLDKLPADKIENVKNTLEKLKVRQFKLLFSGRQANYSRILPLEGMTVGGDIPIPRFKDEEVMDNYLKEFKDLDVELQDTLVKATQGMAVKLDFFKDKLRTSVDLSPYLTIDSNDVDDLYAVDFVKIKDCDDSQAFILLALVAFAGIPMEKKAVTDLLHVSDDDFTMLLKICESFIAVSDNLISFRSESVQKYIRRELNYLQEKVSLLMIDYFENHLEQFLTFLPALIKKYRKGRLLNFLKSDSVLNILVEKKSQAALNVQCAYGFGECEKSAKLPDLMPFSLFKSASKQIERNGLWDHEIDALVAIGDYATAVTLAQNVYLVEEKLKCYAIIVSDQYKHSGVVDSALMQEIRDLHLQIDYSNIPDLSVELAKLLLPIDYSLSMEIVDRIANEDESRDKDHIYASMSISAMTDKAAEGSNEERYEQLSSKINNEGLRKFTDALKVLFHDYSVDQLLQKVEELPTLTQQLMLLQNWIPSNRKKSGIYRVVRKAVDLIVALSDEKIPKGSVLSRIVTALPYLDQSELQDILRTIDQIKHEVRYPSDNYTRVQLRVIQAQAIFDMPDATRRMKDLFNTVNNLSNQSATLNCYAIILNSYEALSERGLKEENIPTEERIMQSVKQSVQKLFLESAYQYKIVERPIKSLICRYPDMVIEMISQMNTLENQSRAYLLAANEYLNQTNISNLDWELLQKLICLIKDYLGLRSEVLLNLIYKCYKYSEEVKKHPEKLKRFDTLLNQMEKCEDRCEAFGLMYVLFSGIEGQEEYTKSLLKRALEHWDNIQMERIKIIRGFFLGKLLSTVNMEKAKEIVNTSCEMKRDHILSSSSGILTYLMSLDIYVRSLGVAIRCGMAQDDTIDNFQRLLDEINSPTDSLIYWSDLALNYELAGERPKFKKILNEKIMILLHTTAFCQSSVFNHKQVLYHIAPCLYLDSSALFYSMIEPYDEYFKNACVEHTLKFIMLKHPNVNEVKWEICHSKFVNDDVYPVIDLLKHCSDDLVIFEMVEVICRTVRDAPVRDFSRLQKQHLWTELTSIINNQLPSALGIQHKGYQIVCKAALQMIAPQKDRNFWSNLEREIMVVPNKADQAFIYVTASQFIPNDYQNQKDDYIRKGFNISSKLSPHYDRTNRMDMCLSSARGKRTIMSNLVDTSLLEMMCDGDGTLEGRRKIIDLAQQYDEKIAERLINQMDADPARRYYKNEACSRFEHNRRIEGAKKNLSTVRRLNEEEFEEYFKEMLNKQLLSMEVRWDENEMFDIIQSMYKFPLSVTYDCVMSIIENISRMTASKYRNQLISVLCHSCFWNLKIVLSLASGTKEKLERINHAIKEYYERNELVIHIGERKKAIELIKTWFSKSKMSELRIIDAFFKPEDLFIIKELLDISNKLKVQILTLSKNAVSITDYQDKWEELCSNTNVDIVIESVHYKEDPLSGPFHERYWILTDQKSFDGLETNSLSGYGNKESKLRPLNDSELNVILDMWDRLFVERAKVFHGMQLKTFVAVIS